MDIESLCLTLRHISVGGVDHLPMKDVFSDVKNEAKEGKRGIYQCLVPWLERPAGDRKEDE
jgi:hypothetical protein